MSKAIKMIPSYQQISNNVIKYMYMYEIIKQGCYKAMNVEIRKLCFSLKSDDDDFDYGTECLLLAMKYTGTRAKLFTGPDNLWKVGYLHEIISFWNIQCLVC